MTRTAWLRRRVAGEYPPQGPTAVRFGQVLAGCGIGLAILLPSGLVAELVRRIAAGPDEPGETAGAICAAVTALAFETAAIVGFARRGRKGIAIGVSVFVALILLSGAFMAILIATCWPRC